MSYLELIERALKGRSVYAAAKQWGIPQKTLDNYANGKRLPGFGLTRLLAKEAGISDGEALATLAEEEAKMKSKDKVSASFNTLLRTASIYWTKTQQMA